MTPPRDHDSFSATLISHAAKVSKRLSQVARFLLNHPGTVALNSLARLLMLAQVSPATITRFAKAPEYRDFSDLQSVFRKRLLRPDLH